MLLELSLQKLYFFIYLEGRWRFIILSNFCLLSHWQSIYFTSGLFEFGRFRKSLTLDGYLLSGFLERLVMDMTFALRKEQCVLPKVNTERFMTSYVNRLIFEHKIM